MAINNVGNGNSTAQTQAADATSTATPKTGKDQALGRDAFMQLLVAQLKNQDPLEPVKTENFVTQLSQLTSVEKMVEMSDQLKALQGATDGMAASQSAALIGKKVTAVNDSVQLGSTGAVQSTVNLGNGAASATVKVKNQAGRVVQEFKLTNVTAGNNKIAWDGKAAAGERAAAGTYTFEVDAKDVKGNPVAADQVVTGTVSGVQYDRGYPELVLGETRVRLSSVTSIGQ